jgi:hypothetical protein
MAYPTLSANPIIEELLVGNVFNATMPNLAPGTGSNYAWQLWNPTTNTKRLYVFSLTYENGGANSANLYTTTAQISLNTPSPGTIQNLNQGSTNQSNAVCQYSTVGGAPSLTNTTLFHTPTTAATSTIEIFGNGSGIILPPGTGLMLYTFLNSGNLFVCTARYVEF